MFFLYINSPAWAAIALVTNRADQGPIFGDAFTSGSLDTTGANLIVIYILSGNSSISSVTDNKSNTVTGLNQYAGGPFANTYWSQIFYITNPTVGSGHTFTIASPSTNVYGSMFVASFSGTNTSSPFDVQNGGGSSGNNVTTQQPGSITPGSDNELIVSGVVSGLGSGTSISSVDSGMTITDSIAGSNFYSGAGAMSYIVQTSAGAINPTWTAGTSDIMSSAIASFKAGAGGGGPAAIQNRILQMPIFLR